MDIAIVTATVAGLFAAPTADAQDYPNPKAWKPTPDELRRIIYGEASTLLCNADLTGRDLADEVMPSADLNFANLSRSRLEGADLRNSSLFGARLEDANLVQADLSDSHLVRANLVNADMRQSNLSGASLNGSNLSRARLNGADLSDADLTNADVTGARFAHADISYAVYAPTSEPPGAYVVGLKGLSTVVFPPGMEAGLVQLRQSGHLEKPLADEGRP